MRSSWRWITKLGRSTSFDADGKRFTIVADERIGGLEHIAARDRIVTEYLQSVAIVVAPANADIPLGDAGVLAVSDDKEHPAVTAAETTVTVATVTAFNEAQRLATLKLEDGTCRPLP